MQGEVWDRVGFWVASSFLLMAGLVGLFDVWAVLGPGGGTPTVSSYVHKWVGDYPIIGFIMGFVLGHLFFPMIPGK